MDIVDHFVTNVGLVLVGLVQCLVVGYVFGARRLREYVNKDSDFHVGRWWEMLIKWITPFILTILMVRILIERIITPYEGYPKWTLFVGGWGVIILVTVLALILMAIKGKTKT